MKRKQPISISVANIFNQNKGRLSNYRTIQGKALFINGSFSKYQSSKAFKTLNTTLSTFNSQYNKFKENHRQLNANNSNFSRMYHLFYAQTEGSSIKNLLLPNIASLSKDEDEVNNDEEEEGDDNNKIKNDIDNENHNSIISRNKNKIKNDNMIENIFSSSLLLVPNKKMKYLSETQSTSATFKSERDYLSKCIKRISRPDISDNEYYTALKKLEEKKQEQEKDIKQINKDNKHKESQENNNQEKAYSNRSTILNLLSNKGYRISLPKFINKSRNTIDVNDLYKQGEISNKRNMIDFSFESINNHFAMRQEKGNKTSKATTTINFENVFNKGLLKKDSKNNINQSEITLNPPIRKEIKLKKEKTKSLLKLYDKVSNDEKAFKFPTTKPLKIIQSNKNLIMNYFTKHSTERTINKMKAIEHEDSSNLFEMIIPAQVKTEKTDIHKIINNYEYKNGAMNFNRGKLGTLTNVNSQIADLDKQSIRDLLKK